MLVRPPDAVANTSVSCHEHQHILASTPVCLGNSTRRRLQLVLAQTPDCRGINTRARACLGVNQHVLASTPECLGNSTRQPYQRVLARTPSCLGVNTRMPLQQHQATPMSWRPTSMSCALPAGGIQPPQDWSCPGKKQAKMRNGDDPKASAKSPCPDMAAGRKTMWTPRHADSCEDMLVEAKTCWWLCQDMLGRAPGLFPLDGVAAKKTCLCSCQDMLGRAPGAVVKLPRRSC